MRCVIQRVSEGRVEVTDRTIGKIGRGLVVLIGFENGDSEDDLLWMRKKLLNLRIFNDENDVMNLSLLEVEGELLLVSQFTLHASTKKGNRPSYINAAKPDVAIPLYEKFIALCQEELNNKVQTGEFGADMKVSLCNDGPVTISIDSKNRE